MLIPNVLFQLPGDRNETNKSQCITELRDNDIDLENTSYPEPRSDVKLENSQIHATRTRKVNKRGRHRLLAYQHYLVEERGLLPSKLMVTEASKPQKRSNI